VIILPFPSLTFIQTKNRERYLKRLTIGYSLFFPTTLIWRQELYDSL
jgi:hypothetical protein